MMYFRIRTSVGCRGEEHTCSESLYDIGIITVLTYPIPITTGIDA